MPALTDSIGRVLGDRYRLVTPLGTGASAHVYLADDVTLHRQVAVKVLHPALAGDRSFLKRFRAEARAVAALSHPNILAVHDWGEEEDQPYLVLEYLPGGSLLQVYDTGALLTPAQAVSIGIEAAAGLDYAHRRGIVHRDVKPANLLFDAERHLRIADFGLARALADAAWTEPDGAILGTARYAAPEQVEGLVLDGKADVYALALVLYEGVTGEAPFVGDTTVATLMARVGALLPEHEALGPLAETLVWAAAPDPDERYDAPMLRTRLMALAATLPDPDPLPLAAGVPAEDAEAAGRAPVRPARRLPLVDDRDATEIGAPEALAAATAGARPQPFTAGTGEAGAVEEADAAGVPARARRRWPWIVLAFLLVAALLAGGAVWAVRAKLFTPSHAVPVLVGRTLTSAEKAAGPGHFTVRVTGRAHSITVPSGQIVSQQPAARSGGKAVVAKEGSVLAVVLSTGPPPVAIPDLSSFTSCADAVGALKAVHLVGVCPAAAAEYSETVVAGAVIATTPAGSAPYGTTVTIVTSKGHAPVVVPAAAATASSYPAAAAALTAVGFAPVESKQYSPTVPVDQVIGVTPAPSAGPQPFGATVTVAVSLGPQPVVIPTSLIGEPVGAATAALGALGLQVGGPYGPPGAKRVLSTEPTPGTSVLPGTTVNLYSQ